MLAIQNQYWPVMKELGDHGADVCFSNNQGQNPIYLVETSNADRSIREQHKNYLLNKSFLNEAYLQNLLIQATHNYKLAGTQRDQEEVLDQLAVIITGENRSWRNDEETIYEYRMQLENIQNLTVEHNRNTLSPQGIDASTSLKIRLHQYLELFIKIAAKEIGELPQDLTIDATLERLFIEIKTLTQTFIGEKILPYIAGDNSLMKQRAERIIKEFEQSGIG